MMRPLWLSALVFAVVPGLSGCEQAHTPVRNTELAIEATPKIKIIKDYLVDRDDFYLVRGMAYNPNTEAVKNVVIRYYIWKKWMGQKDRGQAIRDTGGLVQAVIKYMPPKSSVEFVATGGDDAPVMSVQSGLLPDELQAEISGQWDE